MLSSTAAKLRWVLVIALFAVAGSVGGQQLFVPQDEPLPQPQPGSSVALRGPLLIRAPQPAVLSGRSYRVGIHGGYETGTIPTAVMGPRLSLGIGGNLQIAASATGALFVSPRLVRLPEATAAVSIGGSGAAFYFSGRFGFGEPVAVPYEGDLPDVYAVVAEHGDPGIDAAAGLALHTPGFLAALPLDWVFWAEYALTGLRRYSGAYSRGSARHRITANATPFLPRTDAARDGHVVLAVQNRITYWFSRGTMYEVLPQLTVRPGERFATSVGVSVPVVGGGVVKILAEAEVTGEIAERTPREVRITVDDLYFPPDQAILLGPANAKSAQNRRIIEELAEGLREYPDHNVVVEGHTSWVHWDDPVLGKAEYNEELVPLSQARAEAVMNALAGAGVPARQMRAVGKAASEPVVDFSILDEQWKNRRVEIVLRRAGFLVRAWRAVFRTPEGGGDA
jgi:outer membrane protein OmpA-like peptidoglycan-associated protein